MPGCGCFYHDDCVRKLPGTTSGSGGGFCRLIRCIRCPLAYHPSDSCLAAGSVILTHHIMICSNHGSTKKNGLLSSPVNVGWCFLCARAEICNPRLVPSNIQSLRHDIGDFPVFFFGSHDYYWINQGRVFPYVENNKNFVTGQININKTFKKETEVIKTEGRGWGLKTNQALRKGDFVTEYVGEVIDSEECQQRIKRAHENHVTNFYMLTLTKVKMLPLLADIQLQPTLCRQQEEVLSLRIRQLLGIPRSAANGEHVYFQLPKSKPGIGSSASDIISFVFCVLQSTRVVMEKEERSKNAKLKPKKRKLRPEGKHTHEYFCFHCGEGGELVMCDRKDCPKAYHLLCLNLTKPPYGRWECPWHDCSICGASASSLCDFCPRSFCQDHEAGALTASSLDDRLCCSNHNPLSPLGSVSTQPRLFDRSPIRVKEESEEGRPAKE
ncbi:hypothetical protein XENOCAPTIV_003277 [Xenoophorus captivus]|uniref:PHD-type domain-containing protein n=1 Tax=Xenoophorus captivus TaxID=1517983 RepID=A0ABV0R3H3_9TELE